MLVLSLATAPWSLAQTTESEIRALVPFSALKAQVPTLTLDQYNAAVRALARERSGLPPRMPAIPTFEPVAPVTPAPNLGRLGGNRFLPDSTANPFGAGNPYSPNSIKNRYGPYGSPYSPSSVRNPFAVDPPNLVGADGNYLGKLSTNPYDPNSVANPYGRYGSRYSPDSINNPYGVYGSPYSPLSPNNPYTTTPPLIVPPKK